MSLIVAGIVAGIAATAAGAVFGARRLLRRSTARMVEASPPPDAPHRELPGLDVQLGDVVLFGGEEEAWLRGVLLLEEGRACVAALFFTHHGAAGDIVLVQPVPQRLLLRMKPAALDLAGPPADVVEYGGQRYCRKLRRPVRIGRVGDDLPPTGASATWSWFEAADGTVLGALVSDSHSLAWAADPSAAPSAVRLAAGKATFRPL